MGDAPIPLLLAPGIVTSESGLSAKGRYIDASWVRFFRGKPQFIGGYASLIANKVLKGVPRGAVAWSDTSSRQLIGVGTSKKLYSIANTDFIPKDITPWRVSTANLANPIATTNGSNVVTVAYAAHGAAIGDYVDISGADPIAGLDVNGSWEIDSLPDAGHVTFKHTDAANADVAAGGGAAVTVGFEISPGLTDPAQGYGWGAGAWGEGTWGTPRQFTLLSFTPRVWTFGSFGRILIACPINGALYSYDPSAVPAERAKKITTGAPTTCSGVIVTSDRIVIAYGTNYNDGLVGPGAPVDQDLLQFWNAAQGDYTNWDVTASYGANGAPSRVNRLKEGTRIVGGVDLGVHVSLLWTDTAIYALQYTGSQFVFNTQLVGKECGLMGPLAFAVVGTTAYWAGPHGFFTYSGGVQRIPNQEEVSQWVIDNLRPYYSVKTVAWYNQRFNEVWFAFVPPDVMEPTYYVAVNLSDFSWTKGVLPQAMSSATRLTGDDPRPIAAGSNGVVYQMDNGMTADGAAISWFLQTAPMEPGAGEQFIEVSGLAIDMKRQSDTIIVKAEGYNRTPAGAVPVDTQTTSFAPGEEVADLRVSGRSIALRFSGTGLNQDFRFGILKALTGAGGARR